MTTPYVEIRSPYEAMFVFRRIAVLEVNRKTSEFIHEFFLALCFVMFTNLLAGTTRNKLFPER